MPTFHYQARRRDGQIVTGRLVAESAAEAVTRLDGEGLAVEAIQVVHSADPVTSAAVGVPRAPHVPDDVTRRDDLAALAQPWQRVWAHGRPFLPALRALVAELPAGADRREWSQLLAALEQPTHDAAQRMLEARPDLCFPLFRFLDRDGDPVQALRDCLAETRQVVELRRRRTRLIAYPALIAAIALVLFVMLSVCVVPMFRTMFLEMAIRLPLATRALLALSELITSGWIVPILAGVALLGGLSLWCVRRLPAAWRTWCGDLWGTPLGRATANARLANFLADLLSAGIDLPVALRCAGRAAKSPRLERATRRLADQVSVARGAVQDAPVWPIPQSVAFALVSVTPESARVRVLRELSANFATRSQFDTEWKRSLFEPLAICVIGGVVAATALMLYWPMIGLIHALS